MGRDAAGVIGIRLANKGDKVVGMGVINESNDILVLTETGYGKRVANAEFRPKHRGGQGVRGIKLTGKKGEVVAAFMVGLDDEIVAVSKSGVTIRMEVRGISSQGRTATGVRIMNMDDGDIVGSVAPILSTDD